MILVLDIKNVCYHHDFDKEVGQGSGVRVPETNSKKYNVELMRKFGAQRITVKRHVSRRHPTSVLLSFTLRFHKKLGLRFVG